MPLGLPEPHDTPCASIHEALEGSKATAIMAVCLWIHLHNLGHIALTVIPHHARYCSRVHFIAQTRTCLAVANGPAALSLVISNSAGATVAAAQVSVHVSCSTTCHARVWAFSESSCEPSRSPRMFTCIAAGLMAVDSGQNNRHASITWTPQALTTHSRASVPLGSGHKYACYFLIVASTQKLSRSYLDKKPCTRVC